MVTVLSIQPGDAAEKAFFVLPRRIYAHDPHWIDPGPRTERDAWLDPHYAKQQCTFLALSEERATGRCVVRHDPASDTGTIGFFETINDLDTCRSLLGAAEQWLQQRGAAHVRGPMDGDTWQRYRWSMPPLEETPFLKEPWNPPYYPDLWEACGYTATDRYTSSRIHEPAAAGMALAPFVRRAERQGYTFRPIRLDVWQSELECLYRLSSAIFADNRHYTAIAPDTFMRMYEDARSLIIPSLCRFCCNPNGEEIGFVFCYPDLAAAVRAMRGRRDWPAKLRFLWRRRHVQRVCIKSLGSLPRYHGTGIGPALMAIACNEIARLGYGEALMCLMHENNDSRRLDGGQSEPFRSYVLYGKALESSVDR